MRLHGPDEPVYTIGVVARLLGISPQSLRQFEREGLVAPTRTENNIRLYSQNELLILRRICELVKIEGVNIAGVRAVLRVERRFGIVERVEIARIAPEPGPSGPDDPAAGPPESDGDPEWDADSPGGPRPPGVDRRGRGGAGLF